MSEEIKDIFECLKKYANLTPDAIDDLYYLEGTIEDLQQKVEQLEKELQITANKCKQLENIIKEAIKLLKKCGIVDEKGNFNAYLDTIELKDLLNILNKGGISK